MKKKKSALEKWADPRWREEFQAEQERRMKSDPEFAAAMNSIYEDLARRDLEIKVKRERVESLRKTSAGLSTEQKAEAWLRFVLEDPESFSDLEALVLLVSREKNCDKEIRWTIQAWREAEQRSFENCARGNASMRLPDGTTEYCGGMSLAEARDISRRSIYQLENFWKQSRGPYPAEASMLRVADWCNIGGYEKWWARFVKDYKEYILTGPPEKPLLIWGLFDFCRSEYAIRIMSHVLGRAMDIAEICSLYTTMPWTDYREKQKLDGTRYLSYDEYLPHAASFAFCSGRLANWSDTNDLVKEAISTIEKYQLDKGGWGYWSDSAEASIEVTAMVMHAIAFAGQGTPNRLMRDAATWLRSQQDSAGYWQEESSPDPVRLTVLVLDALALADQGPQTTLGRNSGNLISTSSSKPGTSSSPDPSKKRFKVALSFPGEERSRVEAVAGCLIVEYGREQVFYDNNFKSEIATIDADLHLQEIYENESDLVVVWLGEFYEKKMWCGLEWRAIRQIIAKRERNAIMFIKVDDSKISGVFPTDGYIDARTHSESEIARLIIERVTSIKNSGR